MVSFIIVFLCKYCSVGSKASKSGLHMRLSEVGNVPKWRSRVEAQLGPRWSALNTNALPLLLLQLPYFQLLLRLGWYHRIVITRTWKWPPGKESQSAELGGSKSACNSEGRLAELVTMTSSMPKQTGSVTSTVHLKQILGWRMDDDNGITKESECFGKLRKWWYILVVHYVL